MHPAHPASSGASRVVAGLGVMGSLREETVRALADGLSSNMRNPGGISVPRVLTRPRGGPPKLRPRLVCGLRAPGLSGEKFPSLLAHLGLSKTSLTRRALAGGERSLLAFEASKLLSSPSSSSSSLVLWCGPGSGPPMLLSTGRVPASAPLPRPWGRTLPRSGRWELPRERRGLLEESGRGRQ
eukprot:scaffold5169_cov366-Prasinococcus_capsulatus_cf.AAC.5